MFRIVGGVAAASLFGLVTVACAGPGQGIVDRISAANSPIVREVSFGPASFWQGNGEAITVFLP